MDFKTIEDVQCASIEDIWYAWRFMEQGKKSYSEEVIMEMARQLSLSGM